MNLPEVEDEIEINVNSKYEGIFTTDCRYILLYGGRGSSKSYTAAQFFIIKSRSPEYFRGYIMREIAGDIKDSQFQEIKDQIEDYGIAHEYHITEKPITITHKITGNKILAKGFKKSAGNQTAKVKSIKDPTHIWIEEADEISAEDFLKADTSIRTTKTSKVQIILTFNPENENSWINKRWFINNQPAPDSESFILHTTYKDNMANLQPSYVATLEKLLTDNPEYAKIYVKGEWGGGAKGQVYTTWQKIAVDDIPEGLPYIHALDFGFTNDPSAVPKIYIGTNKLYIDEVLYQTGLTNQLLGGLLLQKGLTKNDIIYADSAEPKSIEELNQMGLWVVPALKGPDSILAGISKVKEYIIYVTTRSKNIWQEYKFYTWMEMPDGSFSNKPRDFMNHIMDAIRYGVFTHTHKKKQEAWAI